MKNIACLAAWSILSALLPGQGAAQPAPADDRIAKVYDLGAVLAAVGPVARGAALGARDPGEPPAPPNPARVALEGLGTAVRAFVRPELRADEEVQILGERWLVLLGRAEQHAWLERFIADGAADAIPLGRLVVQVVALPTATFGIEVLPALQQGDAKPGDATLLEPGDATDAFVKAMLAHKDGTRIDVAPVDLLPLRPSSQAVVNQTAYVRDFDVEIAQGTVIADPVVDVIQDGFSLQAVGKSLGESIGLSVQAQLVELQRPIPTFTTTLGVGTPVTIQLPQVSSAKVDAAVEMKPGQVLALTLPPLAGKRCLALVRIDAMPPRKAQGR
ncbi:MAG: hypothetical protein IPK26_09375 [Planctomycetes bacterium]|nr:hypothetical protein [Planctomycetota bacterium]